MKKQIASMWVRALRSGEYKQGKGRLLDKKGHHCSLGVLADISGVNPKMLYEVGDLSGLRHCTGLAYGDGFPTNGRQRQVLGKNSLAEANDAGKSFAEIADWIEENYEVL